MIGRPSKLNEELITQMYDIIKDGVPVTYVCDYFGITKMSFSNWMRQGEEEYTNENYDSLHAKFFYSIKKAQGEFVMDAVRDIGSGRQGWQGRAWILERTRQDFMPKQEISAGEDGKVQVILGGKLKEIKKGNLTKDGEIK